MKIYQCFGCKRPTAEGKLLHCYNESGKEIPAAQMMICKTCLEICGEKQLMAELKKKLKAQGVRYGGTI